MDKEGGIMTLSEWAKVQVTRIIEEDRVRENYLQEIKGLGSMITQNGIYGTLAFYKVKINNKPAAETIISQLNNLAEDYLNINNLDNFPELSNSVYLRLQALAIDAVSWLRRYADILLG